MTKTFCLVATLFVTSVYAEEATAPSTEFLEFLGEWEVTDGQWQDPTLLIEVEVADLKRDDSARIHQQIDEQANEQANEQMIKQVAEEQDHD